MARMAVLPGLTVVRSEPLTVRMRRVTLGGEALRAVTPAGPAQHVRLLFGEPGADVVLPVAGPSGLRWPAHRLRPYGRSMTVRHHDPARGEMAIDVALHGDTPATRWAVGAHPGDPVGVVGPGGGWIPPADARVHVLAGDETALPAIATLLADPRAHAIVEVQDADDEQDLPRVTWLHRARGESLEAAVRAEPSLVDLAAWVAGEGHAVRRLREHLRLERGLDRAHCHAIRYWTRGRSHEDSDVTFGAARAEADRRGVVLATTQDVHEMSYELMTGGFPIPAGATAVRADARR